ncbi:acyltransferase family protein [Neobacillus vireti]|uniref:acyltransferase family protein n=1 Tax=Neobacillus vireti TaxID=220686 RepID=UPI002FFE1E5C
MSGSKRVLGLDIVRSTAIILVLICHSLGSFIIPYLGDTMIGNVANRLIMYPFGFLGVEIFFVLSGFLIGGILIKEVVERGSISNLLNFYVRRWFRTLPLYYLIVLFLILFPTGENFSWQNLIFLQNFSKESLEFNSVTWSLSIEEWFYLAIPPILLIFFSATNNKNKAKNFMIICCSIITLSLIFRIVALLINSDVNFDFGIRKQIFLRLDSIMFGVLFAGIKFYYTDFYDRLVRNRRRVITFALVGLAFCIMWTGFNNREVLNTSFFSRTIFFNIVSIACLLFLASFETVKTTSNKFIKKWITLLSTTSYGVYLIHFQVFLIAEKLINGGNLLIGIITCILSIVITFIISYFVYKYYEIPIMNIRDKFMPKTSNKPSIKKGA